MWVLPVSGVFGAYFGVVFGGIRYPYAMVRTGSTIVVVVFFTPALSDGHTYHQDGRS